MVSELSENTKLRIGAVSYLNAKPLVFQPKDLATHTDLVLDLPSRLADGLAQGKLDVALVPSIECFQHPEYSIVSDACIACCGPVMSVKLLSRVPIHQIRSLALDEGSRTSAVLARTLLYQMYRLMPSLETLPIRGRLDETDADAVLLIGDRAIHPPADGFVERWDLGERWSEWLGLPFVFALWVARRGVDVERVEPALRAARDAGVANLEEIARAEAAKVGLDVQQCLSYLRDNLHFSLGAQEQRGLNTFHRLATELGIVPPNLGPENIGLTTP